MRYFTLVFLLCALVFTNISAQTDSIKPKNKKERTVTLHGEVYDSFTKATVKAFVTLMHQDSTVIDTMTCWTWGTNTYYEFKIPAKQGHYIIKGTCEGYHDAYLDYQLRYLARNNSFELPCLFMKKKQDDIWRESELEGVVVKGTKVKIAYRGDTIVYNASAFNLPEGSMLDGLIRQMPGAELKENGDIYINGKKVDYLTLNGKDFFKGQNRVMLDNLPYFTVQNIKVYDKSTKQSELIGHDVEKKDYVMDVVLKREYNRGYLANIEAGGGTDERYLGRLFGLYYDDHSRVSLFANANNVNEIRRPGDDGEWQPSNMPQGLRTTQQTGLHMETEDKDKNWEDEMDVTFDWSDANNWSRTSTERFASEGNLLGSSDSRSQQKDFRFSASNSFQIKKPFTLWGIIDINYANGRRTNNSQDSTFRSALVNQTINESLTRYKSFGISGSLGWHYKFEWGDYIRLSVNASYNRNKPNESYRLNKTYYAQNDSTGLRHYFADIHDDSYNYRANLGYTFQLPTKWYISPYVSFNQSKSNNTNNNFRLDWINHLATDSYQTEWLPSTQDALMSVLDKNNSDVQEHLTRTYSGGFDIQHSDDKSYFYITLPLNHVNERLHYYDYSLDTIARRSYTEFAPNIGFYRWGDKHGINNINYSMSISRPALSSLMPVDDTLNPLATHINNPDLKNTVSHNLHVSFYANSDSLHRFFNLWTNTRITQHSVGTRTAYNTKTGAYTYRQDNIEGNWYWGMGCSYDMPLDKKKLLTLQQRADVEYTHSVDFDVQYADLSMPAEQVLQEASNTSTVNNWTLHERLGLEYQKDKLTIGIRGEVNWRSATSNRQNFERISAFDFNYGGHLRYTIPWIKVSLGTDLRMFSRRGYQSEMMNTDDLVWNAELSRSLFKEKFILKLTAFDLLHQLSNKQYSVNAQGRTETWNNCIPRYVMFSVMYKFSQKPKAN